jgi:hypothetical protein
VHLCPLFPGLWNSNTHPVDLANTDTVYFPALLESLTIKPPSFPWNNRKEADHRSKWCHTCIPPAQPERQQPLYCQVLCMSCSFVAFNTKMCKQDPRQRRPSIQDPPLLHMENAVCGPTLTSCFNSCSAWLRVMCLEYHLWRESTWVSHVMSKWFGGLSFLWDSLMPVTPSIHSNPIEGLPWT